MSEQPFTRALAEYAGQLRLTFSLTVPFDPEDQLKKPMTTLLESAGRIVGRNATAVMESRVAETMPRPPISRRVELEHWRPSRSQRRSAARRYTSLRWRMARMMIASPAILKTTR